MVLLGLLGTSRCLKQLEKAQVRVKSPFSDIIGVWDLKSAKFKTRQMLFMSNLPNLPVNIFCYTVYLLE